MTISRLSLALLLSLCISYVIGHSYVTSPTSRSNQKQTESGCRGPACLGPCDVPLNQAQTPAVTIARGGSINVQWPRNNHAGGFIRFAWAQTSGSDTHANFDSNVQEIHCHEIGGCGPDDPTNPNGGDSGPADGSSGACQTTIQVPLYLTDGQWTLQWAWFGGAFALGDYYSCVDYKIQGGPSGSQSEALYYGGDYSYPGQNKCKFFNTDRLHACVDEPCNNPVYTLSQEQSGPAFGISSAAGQPPATPSTPTTAANPPLSTGALAAPSTPTTAAKPPLSTGARFVAPATTGTGRLSLTTAGAIIRPPALTTGSRPALTTGSRPALTTGSRPVLTTSSTVVTGMPQNCAGLTTLIDGSAVTLTINTVDTWSNVFRMEIQMDAHIDISDWMLQVIWPAEAIDTEVQEVFNAGDLKCSASVPVRHAMIEPVGQWANVIKSGEQMIVELRATNTNMDENFLQTNTQLLLFKK